MEEQRLGYSEQREFLRDKSVPEAQQCIQARLATMEWNEYNIAGNRATADYIAYSLRMGTRTQAHYALRD